MGHLLSGIENGVQMIFEVAGVHAAFAEDGGLEDLLLERDIGDDPFDLEIGEGFFHFRDGFVPGGGPHDELGDHGVVEGGDDAAPVHGAIHADALAEGRRVPGEGARAGHEIMPRVLRVDAAFDGPAVHADVLLAPREGLPGGDGDLRLHEVRAGDHLGDGVFHLDARVHLHEIELSVVGDDEFHRARAAVVHGFRGEDGGLAHAAAQVRRHDGGGGFLDDFLVAALGGAVALAQVDHMALTVGHDLDLHVAGAGEVFLEVDPRIAEGALRFLRGLPERPAQLLFVLHDAHALAAAAGGRLDEDGIADGGRDAPRFVLVGDEPFRAGDDGHARVDHGAAGHGLVAHVADGFAGRADEGDAVIRAHVGEIRVFREEAVARVDGVRPGGAGGLDEAGDVEIAFLRLRGADAVCFVREAHGQGVPVRLGVHRGGADAHLMAGADDARGDLPPVRDQYLAEHGGTSRAAGGLPHPEERLAEFDEVAVLHEDFRDLPFHFGVHFGEDLHRFEDAHHGARRDGVAHFHEGRRFRVGRAVEGAHHGGSDVHDLPGRLGRGGLRGGRRGGGDRGRGDRRGGGGALLEQDAAVAVGEFDFRERGSFEELHQFFDFIQGQQGDPSFITCLPRRS